jgi:hypothetical protein
VYVTKYARMIYETCPSSTSEDILNKFSSHFSKTAFSQMDVDEERGKIKTFCEK